MGNYYNNITFFVEILAAVTGLLLYKRYKFTVAIYFLWFLVYLSICDFLGSYVKYTTKDGFLSFLEGTRFARNFWWTTLYWNIIAIIFFTFYYYYLLVNRFFKVIIKYSTYFFIIFSLTYIIINWDEYFIRFFPVIDVLGAIIIFLCTIFYFIEILLSDRILTFYRSLNFYISTAIFVWWLITTPLIFYDIYNSHTDLNFIFLKWQIYLFANVFMYLTFTFALIWCRPRKD